MDQQQANDAATGAPGTVVVGEKIYLVSQPTDADFVTLRKHLRELFGRSAKSPLKAIMDDLKMLPLHLQAEAIKAAVQQQSGGGSEPTADAMQSILYTPEGCCFWLWLLARKNDRALDIQTVRASITEENVDDILAQIMRATASEDVAGKADGPG